MSKARTLEYSMNMEKTFNIKYLPGRVAFKVDEGTMASILLLGGFAVIGIVFVGLKVISFIRLLLSLFVLPGRSVIACTSHSMIDLLTYFQLRSFGPKGSWALVTGASDGIGKEYALQLARNGFNILLISRTDSKLKALAQEIESTSKSVIITKTLAMDFAANDGADYSRLQSLITDLDIAILVNNVGKSHDIPVPFAQTSPSEMKDIITVNCTGTLRVTALVLPGMIARKRGLVLTMGSFGGTVPTPLLATYSGSKAFLQQWSSALGAELAPHNVTVELVQSYLVTSAMSKIRRASVMVPTPRVFVKAVLGKVGRSGGAQGWAYSSTPYWAHAVMEWALGTFIGFNGKLVVGQNKSSHEAIRRRALRKRERDGGKKVE